MTLLFGDQVEQEMERKIKITSIVFFFFEQNKKYSNYSLNDIFFPIFLYGYIEINVMLAIINALTHWQYFKIFHHR